MAGGQQQFQLLPPDDLDMGDDTQRSAVYDSVHGSLSTLTALDEDEERGGRPLLHHSPRQGGVGGAGVTRGTRASGEGRHILTRSPRLRNEGTSLANSMPRPPMGASPRLIKVALQ